MIDIRKLHPETDIKNIAKEWLDKLVHYMTDIIDVSINKPVRRNFKNRLSKYEYIAYHTIVNDNSLSEVQKRHVIFLLKKYCRNITKYVLADENELKKFVIEQKNEKWIIPIIKDIFVKLYESFAGKFGNEFTNKLNIKTCPYCNRNYIFTVIKTGNYKFSTRPEFDHFYDKSDYPLLALSFYNLVPSCHICNHTKRTNSALVNPYFNGFDTKFRITQLQSTSPKDKYKPEMTANDILALKSENDFQLEFANAAENEKQNIDTFGLKLLYNEHKDFVMEMIDKANAYNDLQKLGLIDAFQGLAYSPQQVFDFVWGRYLEDAELEKRPLSKLTKDILEQLNIER